MDAIREARERSQPIRTRTGGSTFANPRGTEGLGADRRGRVPRTGARRRQGFGAALQFPDQHRQRDRGRPGGARRGRAPPGLRNQRRRRWNGKSGASASPRGRPEVWRHGNETSRGGPEGRVVGGARGVAGQRRGLRQGPARRRLRRQRSRCPARSERHRSNSSPPSRRGVQRPPRPLRRGRLHPGTARHPGAAVHPFRASRLGAGHAQADVQAAVRRGRDPGRRTPDRRSRPRS